MWALSLALVFLAVDMLLEILANLEAGIAMTAGAMAAISTGLARYLGGGDE